MDIKMPDTLYRGDSRRVDGPLEPVLVQITPDHVHTRPAVFATGRIDVAALFMISPRASLFSIGFEHDIAYICIWGTPEEFKTKDKPGFLYTLSAERFEKFGKSYEYQSFSSVTPIEIKEYPSAIEGMMVLGAQVYFINDNGIFDRIVADKTNRAPILKDLVSENQKSGVNIRKF